MSDVVLAIGEIVHVMTRRLFSDDLRRHFVGKVEGVSEQEIRAQGFVFVFHPGTNEYQRRPEQRLRIFSLSDAGNIINVLPKHLDIEALAYRMVDKRLALTDGAGFTLDVNEFGPSS